MLRLLYGLLNSADPLALTLNSLASSDFDGSSAACAIQVQRDGIVEYLQNNSLPYIEQNPGVEYINDNTFDIGDDYEVRLEKTTGIDPPIGLNLDQWYAISETRNWTWTRAVTGVTAFSGTMLIREIADTGNSVSASVTIDCEVF